MVRAGWLQDALASWLLWPAGQLGLVIGIPRLRYEVTFLGLDMEGQPVPVQKGV